MMIVECFPLSTVKTNRSLFAGRVTPGARSGTLLVFPLSRQPRSQHVGRARHLTVRDMRMRRTVIWRPLRLMEYHEVSSVKI